MLEEKQGTPSSSEYDRKLVEHYIASVAHRVQVLRAKLEDSYLLGNAATSTSALSEILLRLLSRFFDELRSLHREADIQPAQDTLRQLQNINYVNSRVVPKLERAIEMANLDTPITPVIEAYVEIASLVRFGTQTIIHPRWDYNASFDEIMHDLRSVAASLGQDTSQAIFSGAPPSFVVITYPIAEQDMILRQAFMAHEVGHYINVVEGLSQSLLRNRIFDAEDRQRIELAVKKQQRAGDSERLLSDANKLAGEFAAYWLLEITADFLGLCLLGPAYLLSFDDVSFTPRFSATGRLHRSHPPVQLRKTIMANLIEEALLPPVHSSDRYRGLGPKEKEVFTTVCGWIHELSQTEPLRFTMIEGAPSMPTEVVESIYAGLRNAVDRAVSKLKNEHWNDLSKRRWFCSTTDLVDAIELQGLLSSGLIPTVLYSDMSRDPSFAAVMNSGWFHLLNAGQQYQYFRRDEEQPHPDEILKSYRNLQNLIGKAVESLQFKAEFERRKGTGGDSEAR